MEDDHPPLDQQNETAQETILRLQEIWTEANKIGDPGPVAPLLAESFVNTDPAGKTHGKAETLAIIQQTRFEGGLDDVKVMLYGHAAVVTGNTHAKGLFGGSPFEVHLRWTLLWVKIKDQVWQCVAGHSSNLIR